MKNGSENQTESTAARAGGAAAEVLGTLGKLGRSLTASLRLPGWHRADSASEAAPPGSSPGIESMADVDRPPAAGTVRIQCVDYGLERAEFQEVTDLGVLLRGPRPEWGRVRWLNVDGLHPYVVNQLRGHFGFHTLAAEDVLRVPQRPKLETYENHLFIVARMLMWRENGLSSEQVSFFFFKDTLITIQEHSGDVWDPIRRRLGKEGSRLRAFDASYLLYALLDAVVDHCFPILEHYGERLEGLEHQVMENPTPKIQQRLHGIKRELGLLRRVIWPMREVMNELQREDTEEIPAAVKAYMRDVYDHAVQVMDIVETCREMAGGLNDLYMSAVSNRMNEVMKVLTIMASFFIPITFVAGVYGMNFDALPELHWKYSYAAFWGVCLTMTAGLAFYFYRKGWISRK
jgi:magnesium transporter